MTLPSGSIHIPDGLTPSARQRSVLFRLFLTLLLATGGLAEPVRATSDPQKAASHPQKSATQPTPAPASAPAVPHFIVVPKDAHDVRTSPGSLDPEAVSVSYKVGAAYPATDLIAEIRRRLEDSGWKPMPREHVVARNPSSLQVGWRSHVVGASGGDKAESYVWSAQWSNPAGDVVGYTLMYKSGPPAPGREGAKPDNDELRVSANVSRKILVPVKDLPSALVLLDGARDVVASREPAFDRVVFDGGGKVSASRDPSLAPTRTKVIYTLASPRPPAPAMTALDERLGGQGWVAAAADPPPFNSAEDWAKTHKPGWEPRDAGTLKEWHAIWRNARGARLDYTVSCPGVEAPAGTDVDCVVEALLRAGAGKPAAGDQASLQPTARPTPRSSAEIGSKVEPAYRKSEYDTLVTLLRESSSGDRSTLERYRADAQKGSPLAQGIVAVMYEEGIGVDKDSKQAGEWFRKAADQGDATAQKYLGDNYRRGTGVPRDSVEAIRWYAKAAGQGDGTARAMIGRMYERGNGVLPDAVSAYAWYTAGIASSNGEIQSDIRQTRKRVAAAMSAAEVARAESLAAGGVAALPAGGSPGDMAWRAVELDDAIWLVDTMFSKGPKGTLQLAGERVTEANGKEVLERLWRERKELAGQMEPTPRPDLGGDWKLSIDPRDECKASKSPDGTASTSQAPVRVVQKGRDVELEFQDKGVKSCGVAAGDIVVVRAQCGGTSPFRFIGRVTDSGIEMTFWDTSSDNRCLLGTLVKSSPR